MEYVDNSREILSERLELLHRAKNAALKSYLSSGLILIPEELSVRYEETYASPHEVPSLVQEIGDALIFSIQQGGSDIYLPVVVEGPGYLLREVRYIDFSKDLDLAVIDQQIADTEERLARMPMNMVE